MELGGHVSDAQKWRPPRVPSTRTAVNEVYAEYRRRLSETRQPRTEAV